MALEQGWMSSDFLKSCEGEAFSHHYGEKDKSGNVFKELVSFSIPDELARKSGLPVGRPVVYNKGIYLQSCLDVYFSFNTKDKGVNHDSTLPYAEQIVKMVNKYGVSKESVAKAYGYLKSLIEKKDLCKVSGWKTYQDRHAQGVCGLIGEALVSLGTIGQLYYDEYGQRSIDDIYAFILGHHREQVMTGLV